MTGPAIPGPPPRRDVGSTDSNPPPRVSIVLATLNERANLPIVVDGIRRSVPAPYEILVVDDGSTDGTREYVETEAARDPRLRPIFHDGKQTTLRAQCQGIAEAKGTYIVVMDADLQHPPSLIPSLLGRLDSGATLAIASRYASGGDPGPRTVPRILLSRGAEIVAKLLLPPARGVTDPVSGYFAFRADAWVPLNPLYRGYKLLLFVLAMTEPTRREEVGFRFEPRPEGTSKLTQGTDFLRLFLIELLLARRLRAVTRGRRSASGDRGSAPAGP